MNSKIDGTNRKIRPPATTTEVQRSVSCANSATPINNIASSARLSATSRLPIRPAIVSGRARAGNMPVSVKKLRQHAAKVAANSASATPLGSIACILLGRNRMDRWVDPRRARRLAHVPLDEAGIIAVEDMAKQAAIEIGGC